MRRAQAADVVEKTDETTTLIFEAGRLKATSLAQERGTNLRVVADGRMGFAGTTDDTPGALLDAAIASARIGEAVDLKLPDPAPLPEVRTHVPRAAAAGFAELRQFGSLLLDRLGRDGCQVNAVVERSVGTVRVANGQGLNVSYDVSALSLSVELTRVSGNDVLIIGDSWSGADLPDAGALERMVDNVLRRLRWSATPSPSPSGSLPVCFSPSGAAPLLLPLQQALLGKSVLQGISPLGARLGKKAFDGAFSLTDDPLAEGRPGSRPCDDEGVPSRQLPLVERGVLRGFIYDLETAARARVTPTGHGRRGTFGKPQAAYSNLVVQPGDKTLEELLGAIDDGLLVDELLGVGQGNVIGGGFSHPVALAWRVTRGEIVGRVKDAAVAGDAYRLLGRIVGLGKELTWRGSIAAPHLLLAGVAVAGRG